DQKQLATRVVKKETLEKKLEQFQTGIFHKQVVPGHECKRCTFYRKPSCINFKDFDVGQIYKKKIVLINASSRVNFCRLVGVSEWLKDVISVHFDPPGKISAGMSCETVVTFKPVVNETLEGEVMFMAQTGPFSVPVRCTAKRCILALDKELIDFGSHVVGETISRTIKLTNSGALGTRFRVQTSSGDSPTCRATAESSPERMVGSKALLRHPFLHSVIESHRILEQLSILWGFVCDFFPPEQVGQDLLNSRSDLDTDKAYNLVELSSEKTPVEILLGKVTEGEIGPFSSVKLPVLFVPAVPGDVQAEFVIVFDNSDCKPVS
ncbi:Uncharacterized protein KIAA1751, partial [Colius striatus]